MVKGKTFKPRKRPIDARIDKYRRFERFFEQRVRTAKEVAWPNECSVTNLMLLQELATPGRSKALTGIAAQLRLDPSYICRELGVLCEEEYVSKERSPVDARIRVYTLTQTGKDLVRRLERSHREVVQRILDALSEGEQKQLARAMSTIRRILGRGEG